MNSRKSMLPVALAVIAGLAGLGLGRLPGRAADPAAAPERGELLMSSTIGATSAFLFVLDTGTRNVAAYEATPGENGGFRLLGARKIEHDLELANYRDLSKFSFFELRDKKNEVGGDKGSGADAKSSQAEDRR